MARKLVNATRDRLVSQNQILTFLLSGAHALSVSPIDHASH